MRRLLKLLSISIIAMPILAVSCGAEQFEKTQSGLVVPKGAKVYNTKKEADDDLRNKTFASANSKERYKNKGGVYAQDVFRSVINNEVDGIIKNLTVAEDFYQGGFVGSGVVHFDKSALIWQEIIAPVDSNGNPQSVSFDDDGFLVDAKAFKTFVIQKSEFENDFSKAAIVHSEIEAILANNVNQEYMIYTPPIDDEDTITEYKIYLFQKKSTSQKISDGWNYFKKNFRFDDNVFKQSTCTYILAPSSRYEALPKNTQPNSEGIASLYGDTHPKPTEKERIIEDTLPAMTALNFGGSDDDWTMRAMPILNNLQFNVSYIKDQKTYEEKIRVNMFEYKNVKVLDPSDPSTMVDSKKIINLNTFYIDAKDAMNFAERINDLEVWKNPEGEFSHKFSFSKRALYDLLKDGQFSPQGLKNDLANILQSMSMMTNLNLFEARTQIIDLISIISEWTSPTFNKSGAFPSYETFSDFCDWLKTVHPTFSLPTLQLILEQLSYRKFPSSPLGVGPLVHYELQLTSGFYKFFAEFLKAAQLI